ncbi:hypothetical protein DM819_03320 [Pseudomonas hunanensis]|uniref:P68 RBP/TagC-like beta-propeller domain-containing protein n=1 Tax=Pseudomonas hunanensis TaxID=1247546 RepID=A0ABD6MVE4_9PSED|nr:hypothetical protein [Pseudomonas hunanensis]NWL44918.1 hypothetical protein [Pseudomonas hunanensis]
MKLGYFPVFAFFYLLSALIGVGAEASTNEQALRENGSSSFQSLSARHLDFNRALNSSSVLFALEKIRGSGGGRNGIQSFAFDERNRTVYTLHLTGMKAGGASIINNYPLDQAVSKVSLGASNPINDVVGHQGLGIEYLADNEIRLWSTYQKDFRQVVRFSYLEGHPVKDVEVFRLFGYDFKTHVSATPAISTDQKYLIAAGRKKDTGEQVVRVWKLADLVRGGVGDYSKRWTYEWSVQDVIDSQHPLQGIASDGRRVWIVAGNSKIDVSKHLAVYTLDGQVIDKNFDVELGQVQARMDGVGKEFEPEGLALINDGGKLYLCVGVVSGDKGYRKVRIYRMPIDKD